MESFIITYTTDKGEIMSSVITGANFIDAITAIDWQISQERMISVIRYSPFNKEAY
jgi:hypothetical protein